MQVEIKLRDWHNLYLELGSVERQLAESALSKAHKDNEILLERAAALRKDAEVAFQALTMAIGESKKQTHGRLITPLA